MSQIFTERCPVAALRFALHVSFSKVNFRYSSREAEATPNDHCDWPGEGSRSDRERVKGSFPGENPGDEQRGRFMNV